MSTAAKFSNNVEISGNVDISGNINLDGTLTVDGSFSLYGYHIPDPSGENNKVLTISGDGYSWETVQSGSDGDEEINAAGQTFYQIITEQPRVFTSIDKNGSSFESTTSSIDISWSFNNIIPFDDTTGEQKILNINDDMITKVLPCITKIHFDISSTISDSGSVDISGNINVDTTDNYYIDSKSTPGQGDIVSGRLTYVFDYNGLTILNSGTDFNTYTINVWGENDSNGTNTFYKLTYTNLKFKSSGIPKTPAIRNTSIYTDTQSDLINFTIDISISDLDIDNSDTKLDGSIYIERVDLSYSLIGASSGLLRSSFYGDGDHAGGSVINDTDYNSSGIIHTTLDDTGTEHEVNLQVNYEQNFFFGAKYELQVKVKNNLAEDDTSYSSISTTSYTDIPHSDGVSIDTFSTNTLTLKNKDNGNLGKTDIINMDDIYLYNLAQIASTNTNARILPNNTSTRTIEISDPNNTNTTDTTGFGKFIDNSTNLVTITCNLKRGGMNSESDVLLQELNYDGWNSSSSYTNVTSIADYSDNNIEPFTSISTSDIYSSEDKKGFRIKGTFETENQKLLIKDLSNAQLIGPLEASGNTGYIINYNYYRQDGNSVTTDVNSNSFFVDNFPNYDNPNYTTDLSTVTVTGISWVMGIPQVSTVDISFTRNHININSEYKYFQSDGLVAEVNSIKANGTSGTSVYSGNNNDLKYLYLTYSGLNTDGSYNVSFDGSLNYSNITSSQSSNTVISLVVNTDVHNLYTSLDYNETFSVAHYRDVASISNYSSVFQSDSTNNIYELSYNTISDLSSNFYSVHTSLDVYDNSKHEKEIQSHTIPFISGSFTVDDSNYQDICGLFEWNGNIDGYNNSVYIDKNDGIDLDGTSGGDYKWIVYEVDTESSDYISGKYPGIDLTFIINKLFNSSIQDAVYNIINTTDYLNNTDILIYVVAYNSTLNKYVFGVINEGNESSNVYDGDTPWHDSNSFGDTGDSIKGLSSLNGTGSTKGAKIITSSVPNKSSITGSNESDGGNDVIYVPSFTNSFFIYFALKIN